MPRIRPEGGVIGLNNTPTLAAATGVWTMPDVVRNLRNSTWPAGAGNADPYFNLNSLLIHADGTDGKTNVSYVDESSNAYTATAGGKPLQGTFSPFSQTGWSNFFNGSSDYLTVPAGANFAYGTGNFTIEGWIYPTTLSGNPLIWSQSVSGTNYFLIGIDSASSKVGFTFATSGGGTNIFSSTTVTTNTWYHFAVVRNSNVVTVYVNGVGGTPTACAQDFSNTTYVPTIGRYTHTASQYYGGYLSDLRVVKGSAVYTGSSFTPPTLPLTAITNTVLLTCQSNRFRDSSTNNLTVTPAGTPSVQPFEAVAPGSAYSTTSVGGSAYFNGSADYITLPSNMTAVGNGAYTLEGWFYPTTVSAVEIPIVKLYNATQTIEFRIVSSKIQGRINGSATIVGGNTTLYPNQWYHFALVKPTAGTSAAVLYINGVAELTTANDTTTYTAFTTPRVGANQVPNIYYTGWASGVRFIRGVAQYSANFTPPTSPPTNVASTLFLLNFTNAGIIDQAAKNNLTTFGAAAISTAQSKFGGGSMIFNGSSSYLTMSLSNASTNFGTGDFTIECWHYLTSRATLYPCIFGNYNSYAGGALALFAGHAAASTTAYQVAYNGATFPTSINSGAITYNQWVHVALVRSGSTITLYINGTSIGTITSATASLNGVGSTFYIGASGDNIANSYINGYIDDFRISRYARYTTNFTPPVAAFIDF